MSKPTPFPDPLPASSHGQSAYPSNPLMAAPQNYAGASNIPMSDGTSFGAMEPDELGVPARYPRGPWGSWLRLTMPRTPANTVMTATMREQLRHAQILAVLLAVTTVALIGLTPTAFIPVFDLGNIIGVALGFVLIIISIILCRTGRVTATSFVYVLGSVLCIVIVQVFPTDGTLGMQDLQAFDLFTIPIVFAGILLPRFASIAIWFGAAIFTTLDLQFQPHKVNLSQYIGTGNILPVAIIPIALSAILAVASWVAAGSVERAIMQADRTADVAQAYAAITEQKRRLEEAVALIQNVHARVANGDMSARAPISGGELVSLAVSLNLMLERLSRSLAAESALGGMEQSVQRLNSAISELAQGRIGRAIPQQGFGQLSPIAYNLELLRSGFVQVARNSQTMVDHIRTTAHEMLTMNHALVDGLAQRATPDEQTYTHDMQARLGQMEHDLTQVIDQLHQFLVRFTG